MLTHIPKPVLSVRARRRLALAAPVLSVLIAGPLAGATSASAATTTTTDVVSGVYHVTAAGKAWNLSLYVGSTSTVTDFAATLARGSAAGYEEHRWQADVTGSGIVTPVSGGWKIDPPAAAVSPLFIMNLRFTTTGHTKAVCTTGSETVYTGRLSGVLKIATGLAKAPSIGSSAVSFSTPNTVIVDNGCVPAKPPCAVSSGASWSGYTVSPTGGPAIDLNGSQTSAGKVFAVTRTTPLSAPSGASRVDEAVDLSGTLTISGGTMTTVGPPGDAVTGKVSITTPKPPVAITESCWIKGVKHSQTFKMYGTGSPEAPLTSTAVGHTLLSGNLASNPTGYGTFTTITVK